MMGMAHRLLADASGGFWMPEQASDYAVKVDSLYDFILYLSVFFFVLIIGVTAYFSWKYRKRHENQRTSPLKHSFRIEFLWSAIPTVLLVVIFAWGFSDFTALSATPQDALKVRVVAKQWNWSLSYPGLDRECTPEMDPIDGIYNTDFYVPVDRPVTFQISAEDVLHSFWIPAFRAKRDALPNRYTGFTVTPTQTGTFRMYCAEYCGKDHSRMAGWVHVLSAEEWEQWLSKEDQRCKLDPESPEYPARLFGKLGCGSCHTVTEDRAVKVGPALYGIDGKSEAMEGGETITVDANYIRESIEAPGKKIVAGFAGASAMPAFAGRLNEQELQTLVDYVMGLDDPPRGGEDGDPSNDGDTGDDAPTDGGE